MKLIAIILLLRTTREEILRLQIKPLILGSAWFRMWHNRLNRV